VRIVVPFSAGSITDGLARILADKLATSNDVLRSLALASQFKGLHQIAVN